MKYRPPFFPKSIHHSLPVYPANILCECVFRRDYTIWVPLRSASSQWCWKLKLGEYKYSARCGSACALHKKNYEEEESGKYKCDINLAFGKRGVALLCHRNGVYWGMISNPSTHTFYLLMYTFFLLLLVCFFIAKSHIILYTFIQNQISGVVPDKNSIYFVINFRSITGKKVSSNVYFQFPLIFRCCIRCISALRCVFHIQYL